MSIKIDMSDLVRKIPQIKQAMDDEAKDIADKIALDVFGDLILESPVDTGQARNGWHLDDSGAIIHITNAVAYIGRLARGWSKQAPDGWIDAIIDRRTRF